MHAKTPSPEERAGSRGKNDMKNVLLVAEY